MLTKTRIKELVTIVKKQYPYFSMRDVENAEDAEVGVSLDDSDNYYRNEERVSFANECQSLSSCCGMLELCDLGFGEYHKLTPVAEALFSLWLNEQSNRGAIVIATTAAPHRRTTSTSQEDTLARVGFKRTYRGPNPNTSNQITLWVYELAPSTLDKVKEEPVAKPRRTANTRAGRR